MDRGAMFYLIKQYYKWDYHGLLKLSSGHNGKSDIQFECEGISLRRKNLNRMDFRKHDIVAEFL